MSFCYSLSNHFIKPVLPFYSIHKSLPKKNLKNSLDKSNKPCNNYTMNNRMCKNKRGRKKLPPGQRERVMLTLPTEAYKQLQEVARREFLEVGTVCKTII